MISVQVTYTVKEEFLAQNLTNIKAFLADLKTLTSVNFLYQVYRKEDGLTFVHLSLYENESMQEQIMQVPSFRHFQNERDEHGLATAPLIEKVELIGSSIQNIDSSVLLKFNQPSVQSVV